jgi:alpha-ribazole phosphatase
VSHDRFIHVDLLRHGETEGGARYRSVTDDPLTAAGWEQMWAAVDNDARWETIVTSPLIRCVEFARALASQRTLALRIDGRLREMDFGAWENRRAVELLETEPEALARFWRDPWNHGPPNGESLQHVQARVLAAWHDIVAQRRPALLIGHGGPIRVILCHVLGHPLDKLLEIDVPHAARHRLRVHADESRVLETHAS